MTRRRVLAAVIVAISVAAAGVATASLSAMAAGCGGEDGGSDHFAGSWQRLAGGAPDEDFMLDIAVVGDGYELTFTNRAVGRSLAVDGHVEGDELLCTLPTADGESVAPKWAPALPSEVDVALAVDQSGERLTVSMVSGDGARLPLWEYEQRAD